MHLLAGWILWSRIPFSLWCRDVTFLLFFPVGKCPSCIHAGGLTWLCLSHLGCSLFAWEPCRHCSFSLQALDIALGKPKHSLIFIHFICFIPFYPHPHAWRNLSLLFELISSWEHVTVLIFCTNFVPFLCFRFSPSFMLWKFSSILFSTIFFVSFFELFILRTYITIFVPAYPLNCFYTFAFTCYWKKPEYVTPNMPFWHKIILSRRQLRSIEWRKSSSFST